MTRVVVAEQVRPRRPVELLPELREGAVLAAHVVGAGRELPERRPPHDERLLAELDEYVRFAEPLGNCSTRNSPSRSGSWVRR